MVKAVIFPINNKGGVGKTSLLVDLMTMLSTNYQVGLIDTDHQATLYGAITGDHSQGNLDMRHYADLETRVVELRKGAEFRFAKGSKRMYIGLEPSIAPVSIFPVGMIYEDPSSREKLEGIVAKDMANVEMLGIDLPPIPHPGLILDHSVMPIIQALEDNTQLFPVIVVTPEKNTTEIGLREYRAIESYLLSRGLSENRIHPIVVMNKVLVNFDGNRLWFNGLDFGDGDKLFELGMTFDISKIKEDSKGSFIRFNQRFKYDGQNFRLVWMPFIGGIRHGGYSLLKGAEPDLFTLPQLYRAVMDSGFRDVSIGSDNLISTYSKQMDGLCHFVKAHSGINPGKRYSIAKYSRRVEKVHSLLVADINSGLQDIYEMWKSGEGYKKASNGVYHDDFYDVGGVTIANSPNRRLELWIPKGKLPLEQLAKAIADTETELGLRSRYLDPNWKPGNVKSIIDRLNDHFGYENNLFKAGIPHYEGDRIEIELHLRDNRDMDINRQIEYFGVFLANLDRTFKR